MTSSLSAAKRPLAAVTAGLAAALAGAGAAHAAGTGNSTSPSVSPAFTTDHEKTQCNIDRNDIQFAPLDDKGNPIQWFTANHFERIGAEPVNGIEVKIAQDGGNVSDPGCTRTISLASYTAGGATWQTSALQAFVDVAHTTLNKDTMSATLKVKLPTGADGKPCFGQLDLYFGDTVFDGGTGPGHGPLPHYPDSTTPPPDNLIAAWNGGDDVCAATPPTTTPPSTHPTSPPSTPTSAPTSPSTAPPIVPTTSPSGHVTPPTPTAPATTPGTPTLAHTGASVLPITLTALGFFGVGGGIVFASRRMSARKH